MAGNSLRVMQSVALDVARSAEAGADAGEVGIVVAGMSDQLPCAGGQISGAENARLRHRGRRCRLRRWCRLVVANPSSARMRRQTGSSQRKPPTCAMRAKERHRVARMAHAGSKGLRMARIPRARAARRTGRRTAGNMCGACACRCGSGERRVAGGSAICAADFGLDFGGADAAGEETP